MSVLDELTIDSEEMIQIGIIEIPIKSNNPGIILIANKVPKKEKND